MTDLKAHYVNLLYGEEVDFNMTTKIDDFIKRVESTAEEDFFTPRTFYHLSSSTFHEMCELLKEQEAQIKELEEKLRLLEYGDQDILQSGMMPAT